MNNNKIYLGAIFDLDGVIVDTAKYHYIAWKQLAEELSITFTESDNERFKGVSRLACMDILCELGHQLIPADERVVLANKKNDLYLALIQDINHEEILPGVELVLEALIEKKVKIALGSASKNAPFILERLGLNPYFDAIVDGNCVSKAKPDPEVFLRAAEKIMVEAEDCVVFEDAFAGVEAANRAGMLSVGIGDAEVLYNADIQLVAPSNMGEVLRLF